ncbi:uncharacterized protein SAPINGB_P005855 [Magnusiomyces paraingens]|uniref:D-lactate dehydrogenase (cytochrome) n=1 Tax=Magnusiomyces paraingens TaxID=2606893 RepID=A0A5E8C1J3_9ASCO|nr:uncharacterized protein SAPINGB_P005855 [Saprochaete ingens]VVT57759.1 unnamed protein product [Saprochaete ingens]
MFRQSIGRVQTAVARNAAVKRPATVLQLRQTMKRFSSSSSSSAGAQKSWFGSGAMLFAAGAVSGVAALTLSSSSFTESAQAFSGASVVETSTTKLEELATPKYALPKECEKAYTEIIKLIGAENVTRKKDDLDAHSDTFWNTHHAKPNQRPGIVVFPESTEQVSQIMKITHKYRIPIVPFAGGTSLEGHFTPIYGGVSIDFTRMSSVVALHKKDLDIVVQPGLGWEELDDYLADNDLFFGPDPGPGAQISGMVGTGCSGTNAYRYGTMRENVVGLVVVLADGTIVKTRQRPRKSSAGYNLTQLFIGSEGTLGIVTEATLKLHPRPQNEGIAMVTFDTVKDAAEAAAEVVQGGHQVAAIEILDDVMMKAVNDAGATERKWLERPTIAFKFNGTKGLVDDQVKIVREISAKHGNKTFDFATTPEQRQELWAARKAALWSTIEVAPKGHDAWTTDVAVPISKLGQIVNETKADIVASGLFGTIVGHIGDGNFHTILMYDPVTERKTAEGVVHRMVERALSYEGTCTGEHGVGVGKKLYLAKELGPEAVDLMRRLKESLDPLSLLNPDKVVTINPTSPERGD